MMRDLQSPLIITIKGLLFLLMTLLAGGLLLLESPTLTTAGLLVLCVWAACRFYYFLFCVIQNYVDSEFEYRGILSVIRYALRFLCGGRRQPDA